MIKHSYDINDVTLQQIRTTSMTQFLKKYLWNTSIQRFTREVQGIEMMHLYN